MGDVNDHLAIGRIVRFHVADKLALETVASTPYGPSAALLPNTRSSRMSSPVRSPMRCWSGGTRVCTGVDERDVHWSPLKETA
jgi:hypothetical protein